MIFKNSYACQKTDRSLARQGKPFLLRKEGTGQKRHSSRRGSKTEEIGKRTEWGLHIGSENLQTFSPLQENPGYAADSIKGGVPFRVFAHQSRRGKRRNGVIRKDIGHDPASGKSRNAK